MIGEQFGRLTVIEFIGTNKHRVKIWKCLCSCGKYTETQQGSLRNGTAKSCGCIRGEQLKVVNIKHGLSKTRAFGSWYNMIQRCTNPNDEGFPDYGERGITVCKSWLDSFGNFFKDMGERPEGLQLDRIDNNGNYEPGNCRWTEPRKNVNNRRNTTFLTFKGETLPLTEWCERFNISKLTLRARLYVKGLSVEEALTKPIGRWVK